MQTSSSYALFFMSVNIYKMDAILVQVQCVIQWLYFKKFLNISNWLCLGIVQVFLFNKFLIPYISGQQTH